MHRYPGQLVAAEPPLRVLIAQFVGPSDPQGAIVVYLERLAACRDGRVHFRQMSFPALLRRVKADEPSPLCTGKSQPQRADFIDRDIGNVIGLLNLREKSVILPVELPLLSIGDPLSYGPDPAIRRDADPVTLWGDAVIRAIDAPARAIIGLHPAVEPRLPDPRAAWAAYEHRRVHARRVLQACIFGADRLSTSRIVLPGLAHAHRVAVYIRVTHPQPVLGIDSQGTHGLRRHALLQTMDGVGTAQSPLHQPTKGRRPHRGAIKDEIMDAIRIGPVLHLVGKEIQPVGRCLSRGWREGSAGGRCNAGPRPSRRLVRGGGSSWLGRGHGRDPKSLASRQFHRDDYCQEG